MSANSRMNRTVRQAVMQLNPGQPRGNVARMLTALVVELCWVKVANFLPPPAKRLTEAHLES